jgi:hypothetical protein
LKQGYIIRYIKAQRLAWLGHLERMHEERTTKKITRWKLLSSRPKGRPKKNGKMFYRTFKSLRSRFGRRLYEGSSNERKLLR